jgi:UDP-N-acetyl-D-mannosaminuronic acid transferase (WecB/TagA/CpsF family)
LRPTDRSDLTHASSIDILGCRVDAVDRDSAIELIAERAQVADPSIVVTLGVEMVMNAQRDARFRAIVNRAVLSLCDTIGILLASRARGGPLRERVTGVGLIEPLVARSAERGDLRIYLFGGAPGVGWTTFSAQRNAVWESASAVRSMSSRAWLNGRRFCGNGLASSGCTV